ncbi:hypothetical protein CLG96_02105 [Sphingomonas oleivorans]|uniref:Uncharacterized protein n=1 Tax=Sphingomonas oleivorans TaxID=1735121 RepID=A0A2T5G1D7_9SPHN|nr:hypothetical protein [Sphingomonas oleivorans]PTQ12958.1 hypothetical protein CLG96_02105 [Sphingomonas oleivorans]
MTDQKKVSAFIIRDFGDAGTGEKFKAEAVAPISEGAFTNYQAAGLARKPTADEAKAAKAPA